MKALPLVLALAWCSPAAAQFHGSAYFFDTSPAAAGVGQTVAAVVTYWNMDDFPDRHRVNSMTVTVDHPSGTVSSPNLVAAGSTVTVWRTNGPDVVHLLADGVDVAPSEYVTATYSFLVLPEDEVLPLLVSYGHIAIQDIGGGGGFGGGSYGAQTVMAPTLRIAIKSATSADLAFNVRAGQRYTIEITEDLQTWGPGLLFISDKTGPHTLPISLDGPQRFFRLKVE